jgi:hypothetical protein
LVIYLSGKLKPKYIGQRDDIGLIVSFRPDRPRSTAGHAMKHLAKSVWGADNGCFKNPHIDVTTYLGWLQHLAKYSEKCLFATAPDVVGDARETWRRSEPVLPLIRELGFPAALVAQDGMESYPIRWGSFDTLFIGGSTRWKLSEEAFAIAREAKSHGLHVHMGRVNSRMRLRIAALGLCDSGDGTHFVYRPDLYHARMVAWLDELKGQPFLTYEDKSMKVTHRLQVRALCPVDGKPDVYDCRIVTTRTIPVEEIIAAAEAMKKEKVMQEELCMRLARELGCEVILTGLHSGVATEVICNQFDSMI